jgi:hypothetical protein
MKEYHFSKQNRYICLVSLILTPVLLGIGLFNWMHGLWFLIPISTFWIPLFVYLLYKNGTGVIRYDDSHFEIKSDIWGGSSVNAAWADLKGISTQLRFSNIIFNFGKSGFASFGVDRLDFKRFIVEMLQLLLTKEELSKVTENIAFVKDIDPTTFNGVDYSNKGK